MRFGADILRLGGLAAAFDPEAGQAWANISQANAAAENATALNWTGNNSEGAKTWFNVSGLRASHVYRFYVDGELNATLNSTAGGAVSVNYTAWNGTEHAFRIDSDPVPAITLTAVELTILLFVFAMVFLTVLAFVADPIFFFLAGIAGVGLGFIALQETGNQLLAILLGGLGALLLVMGVAEAVE